MKIYLSCVTILLLILNGSIALHAEDNPPSVELQHVTSYQGHTVTVYLIGRQFDDVNGLDLKLFYDADYLTLISYTKQSWLDSSLTNFSNENGVIQLSILEATGLSGSGRLYALTFRIDAQTPAGEIPLFLAIENAVDSSLDSISMVANHGALTVREVTSQSPQLYTYGSLSKPSLKIGETLTYTVRFSDHVQVGAGTFELHYDHEVLKMVKTTPFLVEILYF